MTENVTRKDRYDCLCIIQGLRLQSEEVESFETTLRVRCDVRVQFLETYITRPDKVEGIRVEGTGGRSDVIFAVHRDDEPKLHIGHRMDMGIRWLDDAIANDPQIYEPRIHDYYK